MGAAEFCTRAHGKTAKEAFASAVEIARYEVGHGGYTGSIAEKSDFKMVFSKEGETPNQCIERCIEDEDHAVEELDFQIEALEAEVAQLKVIRNTRKEKPDA